MHDPAETCALLRNASSFPPTHVVLVNFDERLHDRLEQMAAFLPSLGVTTIHAYRGPDATVPVGDVNEAQLIRMLPDLVSFDPDDAFAWAKAAYRLHRPALVQALRAAAKEWSDAGRGERTVLLFVGVPREPLDAVLLGELPLDAQLLFLRRTGALPLTIRFCVAPRRPYEGEVDAPLAHLLADLEQTYFSLPGRAEEGDADVARGAPSSSSFDTTVWVDGNNDGGELVAMLRDLLRLHGEENARLGDDARGGGDSAALVPSLEAAARADADVRKVDWLSLCAPGHAPRLWTAGLPALMAVLDMAYEKRRASDPLAAIRGYRREDGWDSSLVVQTYLSQIDFPRAAHENLATADFPYRITDDDRASKLEAARYLSDAGAHDLAAELAEELIEDDPDHRLLNRMLGTVLFVAGRRERGAEVLRKCVVLTEADAELGEGPKASEVATLHHLLQDYDAAVSGYERALEADPLSVHAYEGLVMIYRARGEDALADYWTEAARRRGLRLPLVDEGARADGAFEGEGGGDVAASEPDAAPARRRATRWWNFLKG